ncbi:hypothetical protein DM860_011551 [Cuscuta australis]|uniref:Uncharacterized protein n=1 Tax=Cuscuta australis TaxID=267555 RepID=A0A328CZZ5_9ASTE|nr:hypothetical protein DM860_011551 [Cuscuta australis]
MVILGGKEQSSAKKSSRNHTFTFRTQTKVFELFHSYYNKNFCITECGYKRFHLWFDLDTLRWIMESLPRISVNKAWALFSFGDNRTIELAAGSNRRGEFVKIQEKRKEGNRYILIPSGPKNTDLILFFKAVSSFIDKVAKDAITKTLEIAPATTTIAQTSVQTQTTTEHHSLSPPQLDTLGVVTPRLQLEKYHFDSAEHNGLTEAYLRIEGIDKDTTSLECESHLDATQGETVPALFPPLPSSTMSPFAPPFIPVLKNTFAALFSKGHGVENKDKEPLDPFSKINDMSLVHSLNAVEDLIEERDGPILYTHSDGDDKVFIDSKLRPLQVDFSRCFKQPLSLRKELRGTRTFSPSQIVTRSKAKILEEGKKITPLLWEESESQDSFEEEVIKCFKLCCPNKKEVCSKIANKPLKKSQKKKAKKRLKKSMATDIEDDEDDFLH